MLYPTLDFVKARFRFLLVTCRGIARFPSRRERPSLLRRSPSQLVASLNPTPPALSSLFSANVEKNSRSQQTVVLQIRWKKKKNKREKTDCAQGQIGSPYIVPQCKWPSHATVVTYRAVKKVLSSRLIMNSRRLWNSHHQKHKFLRGRGI